MNNTMVREIHGAKINPKIIPKKLGCAKYAEAQITRVNTVNTMAMSYEMKHIQCLK
jgi:hypothetical protein